MTLLAIVPLGLPLAIRRPLVLHGGNGLPTVKITGLQPLCFRVWPYGEEDLEDERHPHEVPTGRFTSVNIDLNIHGVGGNDSWGARTLDPYTNDGNKPYRYGFIMESAP